MALICCPWKERLRRLLLKHWDKCSSESSGWPSGPLGLLGSSSLMSETPESREKTEGNASFAFVSLLHLDAQANMREQMEKKEETKRKGKKKKPFRLLEVVTSYVLLLKLCQFLKKIKPNPVTHKSSRGIQICEGQCGQSWRVVCDKSNSKSPS